MGSHEMFMSSDIRKENNAVEFTAHNVKRII